MSAVNVMTKRGLNDDIFASRGIGDFGISMFHRAGGSYRPEASSLNRVRDGSISRGDQVVEQSLIDRIGFVVME